MANTVIPVELSSTPGIVDGSNATAITIDSSENVGIGTTSPVATLQVKTQADGNLAFQNSTSVTGGVKLNCFNDAANASSPFEIDGSTLQFNIGATEKMRINSSGNVGIGTTSPDNTLHVDASGGGTIKLTRESVSTANFLRVECDGTNGNIVSKQATIFNNGDSERMRITSDGNLLVGQTTLNYNAAGSSMGSGGLIRACVEGGLVLALNRRASDGQIINFYKDGSSVGSISTNADSLPSDRNFKRDISDLDLGLNLVTKLKPSQFRYKISDEDSPIMYGLIAQDLEESLTEVGIEKNSTWLLQHEPKNDEKQSDYSLDYLKLTPVLIKAIQEQQTLIETQQTTINDLKSRIETLEG